MRFSRACPRGRAFAANLSRLDGRNGSRLWRRSTVRRPSRGAGRQCRRPSRFVHMAGIRSDRSFQAMAGRPRDRANAKIHQSPVRRCLDPQGSGWKGFRLSSANQAYTDLFQRLGLTTPISGRGPSLAKMFPFFRKARSGSRRRERTPTIRFPGPGAPIGINYLSDQVPETDSWNVLIDPKIRGRLARSTMP